MMQIILGFTTGILTTLLGISFIALAVIEAKDYYYSLCNDEALFLLVFGISIGISIIEAGLFILYHIYPSMRIAATAILLAPFMFPHGLLSLYYISRLFCRNKRRND